YTATDIEHYHSGQLSAAEMHAMEKAALDDPFLADALEGYTHTATPQADLSALQLKLQLRIENDRKKRIFYIGNNWMKIAALFVVFAGAGWLIFRSAPRNKTNDVATIETVKEKLPEVLTNPVADSVNDVAVAPENSRTLTIQPAPHEPATNNKVTKRQSLPEVGNPSATSLLKETKNFENDQANRSQEIIAPQQSSLVDSQAVARTTMAAKEKMEAFKKSADTINNMDVVMRPTDLAMDEVVVMKNKSVSPQPRRRMQVVVDTLEPAEGWTNFDDYIANNLKMPDELKTKPVRGEVELSFDVNKQGDPINITVVKPLCEKCDEEAIRLLKEGPKWRNNKKKGKIKIKF
ncbi:MAG: hypothetical protein EOO10_21120, partial [Chitinophagaceae bacterium]